MTEYDVVITDGRVIDPETGLDAVRNVGARGGVIASVTEEEIRGNETIDATGCVVCPGFIDTHNHNCGVPFGEKLALRDGVTTPMDLEVGVYPVSTWYASLDGKCRANYGVSAGLMPAREHLFNRAYETKFAGDIVLDVLAPARTPHTSGQWATTVATPAQIDELSRMLEEGLRQGAIGVGNPVGYMVDGVTQRECVLAQKLVARYGQSTFLHGRFSGQNPPTSGLLGCFEMMAPQEAFGGGLVVQHVHAQALGDTLAAFQLFDRAAERGCEILGELYPYHFGATIVGAPFLKPESYGPKMGRTYGDIIEISNMTPLTRERYEDLVRTAPATEVILYHAQEEDVYAAIAHPSSVIGSDALPFVVRETGEAAVGWDVPFDAVNGHPRGSGCHARMLRLVREKKIDIPLTLAVSKMTYMIARFLEANGVPQMANKGRIQVGKDADITIFDPETVRENGTMTTAGLPPDGIPHVLVNGTLVVRDSQNVDRVFPGRPIYGSGKTEVSLRTPRSARTGTT